MTRFSLGLFLIGAPQRALQAAVPAPLDVGSRRAARVLGARDVVQAMATTDLHRARLGVTIDGLHAASMIVLASLDARHRRAALVSAAAASVVGAAGWIVGHQNSGGGR